MVASFHNENALSILVRATAAATGKLLTSLKPEHA
jgi:hypothetical protein